MAVNIRIREQLETDNDQITLILNNAFGKNRFERTVYLYRKTSPIKNLSLVSYMENNPSYVIGTINFYPVLVNNIQCILLGPLAVRTFYQGKGFGKKLVKRGLELAITEGQKICFVSGDYEYYKDFNFYKIKDKDLVISTLGPLSFDNLLVSELKPDSLNLLPKTSKLLPVI